MKYILLLLLLSCVQIQEPSSILDVFICAKFADSHKCQVTIDRGSASGKFILEYIKE